MFALQNELGRQGVTLNDIRNIAANHINVKSQTYGAKGDGVTDDTYAIQTAIDAVSALDGGVVCFPNGIYVVTGLIIKDNVTLQGESRSTVIIKLADNANSNIIEGENYSTVSGGSSDENVRNSSIKNLTIDGNSANNTTGSGIALYATRTLIQDVDIYNVPEHGIRHEYAGASLVLLGNAFEFNRITIENAGKHGFYLQGPVDGELLKCITVDASSSVDNTYDGFHLQTSVRMVSCHSYNRAFQSTRHRYALYHDVFGLWACGCYFEGAKTANAFLTGRRARFDNTCEFSAAGGGENIIIEGVENFIQGYLGPKLDGADNPVGITLGTSTAGASSNVINMIAINQLAGVVDFTYSDGNNYININGINSSADDAITIGTPDSTDFVYINIGGTGSGSLVQYPADSKFTGTFNLSGLPTSDPTVAGELWVDTDASRVIKVSAG